MSYDVDIGNETFNMTWNVGQLFRDHLVSEKGNGLDAIEGLTGAEAALVIGKAFDSLDRLRHSLWATEDVGEPAFCARYDSPNGWGSTVGAILFLGQVMAACVRNPSETVTVCR